MGLLIGRNVDDGGTFVIPHEKSQRIMVCGKTGTGKSYTLGVLIEELANLGNDICLVIDPQGIFWTMAQPNDNIKEADCLWEYDRESKGFRVNLLVPGDPIERYGGKDVVAEIERRGINIQGLRLNPSDLSPEMWCDFFDLDINELQGSMLFKAVRLCHSKMGRDFMLDDISDVVSKIPGGHEKTREAIQRKIEMAQDWQIFEEYRYREVWEILQPNAINVLDLSVIGQGRYGLRNLVVAVLANFIFEVRTRARRREALGLTSDVKKVWMFIDEAHNFCPSGRSTLSKDILIRWAKEGRQPGLSLVVATQQPSALDSEVLTQCGIRIVHRITSRDDYRAINSLSQDFLPDDMQAYIKQLTAPGQTILIDDELEKMIQVQIRPKQSSHGGGSA